jgi:predicted transcriptional regulator of viral defense system
LRRLVAEGAVERVARGLYRFTEAEITEHHTEAAVCLRVPSAIVCLLSALNIHNIGTQLPHQVWIAIPHKARTPRLTVGAFDPSRERAGFRLVSPP